MPSLFDDPTMLLRYAAHRETVYRPTSTVRAPCCGRRTAADMVKDLRTVPNTVVSPGRRGVGTDQDWLCDGCSSRMVRQGQQKRVRAIRTDRPVPNNVWTESKFARAIGEGWKIIRDVRAREIVRERSLTEDVPDFNQAYRVAHDELGDVDVKDPSTEPPTGSEAAT